MTLTFAFNYGGRAEIVDAVRAIAAEARCAARSRPEQDRRADDRRHLYAPDMPDPDVLVRTSGEYRISNFLLWEAAYSELVFTDVLWPDFRRGDLFAAIREFQRRERRFGAHRGMTRLSYTDPRGAAERPAGRSHVSCGRASVTIEMLYRDQGVVLRTIKLGEADRIVSFLTQGHGKVRAVAKGIRQARAAASGPGWSR